MGVGLGTGVGVELLPVGCDDRSFHQDFRKSARSFSNFRSRAVISWSILLTLLEKTSAAEKTSNPNTAELYYNRGFAYDELGQYQEAINDFDKAIQLDPNYITVYNNRGVVHGKLGEYEQAIQDFNKIIELNPGDDIAASAASVVASLFRSLVYDRLSEHDSVKKDFDGGNLRIVDMLGSEPKVT